MTDRYNGIVVTLKEDMREDDAEATLSAIRRIKGVLSVAGNIRKSFDEHIASERLRLSLFKQISEIFFPK